MDKQQQDVIILQTLIQTLIQPNLTRTVIEEEARMSKLRGRGG